MPPEWLTFEAQDGLDAVQSETPGAPPAWATLDYSRLYGLGSRLGTNRPIPGVAGRLAVPKEIDQLELTLMMRLNGLLDRTGARQADSFKGAATNLLYLRHHVLDYKPVRAVTLHGRNGTDYPGELVIEGWTHDVVPEAGGDIIIVSIDISIPAGFLVPA